MLALIVILDALAAVEVKLLFLGAVNFYSCVNNVAATQLTYKFLFGGDFVGDKGTVLDMLAPIVIVEVLATVAGNNIVIP